MVVLNTKSGSRICAVIAIAGDTSEKYDIHLNQARLTADENQGSCYADTNLIKFHLQNSIARYFRPFCWTANAGISDNELPDSNLENDAVAVQVNDFVRSVYRSKMWNAAIV